MGVLFATATSPALIVLFGFLVTVTSNVFCNTYHICQAEIFPTSVKKLRGQHLLDLTVSSGRSLSSS